MGTGKRRENACDDVSASTKKYKPEYEKLTPYQSTRSLVHEATSQMHRKRMQGRDKKENAKKPMNRPSPPRTIEIEGSKAEASRYRSNSIRSNSTNTSSRSNHNTLSTFTPSSAKMKQYDQAMENMERHYTARIKQLEEKIRVMETSKKINKLM